MVAERKHQSPLPTIPSQHAKRAKTPVFPRIFPLKCTPFPLRFPLVPTMAMCKNLSTFFTFSTMHKIVKKRPHPRLFPSKKCTLIPTIPRNPTLRPTDISPTPLTSGCAQAHQSASGLCFATASTRFRTCIL